MRRVPRLLRRALFFFLTLVLVQASPLPADPTSPLPSLTLAEELFEEGNWSSSRAECIRALAEAPGNPRAILWKTLSELRMGTDDAAPDLARLIDPGSDPFVRDRAEIELGLLLWQRAQHDQAIRHLADVFTRTQEPLLILRSACVLHAMIKEEPGLASATSSVRRDRLHAVTVAAPPSLSEECMHRLRPPDQRPSVLVRPFLWLIGFYRRQIRPAIGSRCSLHPSCSEYGRQALHKHGLLGLSMIGDRTVREPGVVATRQGPLKINGQWRYEDSLESHDRWMHGNP